jgi:hypothetical protein
MPDRSGQRFIPGPGAKSEEPFFPSPWSKKKRSDWNRYSALKNCHRRESGSQRLPVLKDLHEHRSVFFTRMKMGSRLRVACAGMTRR